jgi:uncharacterized membrane protein YbhN (UPF0104 family)
MTPRLSGIWRSRLMSAVKVAVSVGLLIWLLRKAGLQSLGNTVSHASWQWLAAGLAFGFLATCVQARQWQALLKAMNLPRRWLSCLRLVFVGNTFNTILPTSIGGDVVRATMAARQPSERVRALTTVVLQRLCNFPGMILIMGVGVVLTLSDPFADRVRPVAIAGALCGIAGLAICTTPLLGWLAQRRTLQRIKIGKLFQELHNFRGEGRQLLLASGRGVVFWGLSVVNWYCFIHAVRVDVSFQFAAVVTTTVAALTMLPVSINGYGVREGGFIAFLALPGLASPPAAVAASLCIAAQSLVWALIGIPFLLTRPRPKAAPASLPALVLSAGRREDAVAPPVNSRTQGQPLILSQGAELTSSKVAR